MIYVGIDPGQKGGVSFVSKVAEFTAAESMPKTPNGLIALITAWNEDYQIQHAFIEKAQPMRKKGKSQGVVSAFTYGYQSGGIEMLFKMLKIPYSLIPPKEWQKEMFVGTKATDEPKDRALEAANRIFPKQNFLASLRCKKQHDGMIDSILIAEYCRRKII